MLLDHGAILVLEPCLFYVAVLCVVSSCEIISMWKRELVVLRFS